jgi:hypothetical protein
VVYDMLLLVGALSAHGDRQQRPTFRGLRWVEAKIAEGVLLLKSRSLPEFLSLGCSSQSDDITIDDFGRAPVILPEHVKMFRGFVNKRSAHLSWERGVESLCLNGTNRLGLLGAAARHASRLRR